MYILFYESDLVVSHPSGSVMTQISDVWRRIREFNIDFLHQEKRKSNNLSIRDKRICLPSLSLMG